MFKIKSEYDDLDKYESFGDFIYYKKGTNIHHNPYGPAVSHVNGYKAYLIENELHRLDGPAAIWPNGCKYYYINNEYLTKEEFEIHPERLKFLDKEYLISLR